jgi:hypothetical protein
MKDDYIKFVNDITIAGLNGDNINEYYQVRFNRWIFDNSDIVSMDGRELDKAEKRMIQISSYNIKPAPKEIIANGFINGSELTETRFIIFEIERILNLDNLSLGKEFNKQDYLKFLYSKQMPLHQQEPPSPENIKSGKDNRFKEYNAEVIAICAHYLSVTGYIPNDLTREALALAIIEKLNVSYELTTIKGRLNTLYSTNTKNTYKPLNRDKAEILLLNFPKAKERLKKDFAETE